jgi:hypothetical protein
MNTRTLLITATIVLLASCVHTGEMEAEIDPEGERPPESELMTAPYIEPVCQCAYAPRAEEIERAEKQRAFINELTRTSP